ncbi:MAG TPA: EpsI family protein [Acidobacteriaceae bacterium]|jgi:EpsI family protein
MKSPRLWCIALLMSFTALVLHMRGDVDKVLPSRPLTEFPTTVGSQSSIDIPIDDETLAILGKGDFLSRVYIRTSAGMTDPSQIGLYVAYFATQRTGQAVHSPQNCLPGAGWTFVSSDVTDFTDSTGKKYSVGDYLITNGAATEEALYWYQLHGRSIASDYKAKIYTLADSIRLGRSDEALVRIITPVNAGEDRAAARSRAIAFAQRITPLLPEFVPN